METTRKELKQLIIKTQDIIDFLNDLKNEGSKYPKVRLLNELLDLRSFLEKEENKMGVRS